MIILAIDALELSLVNKFNCRNLKQIFFDNTDVSEFSLPKTVVLWASFLTGENMESKIKDNLWLYELPMWKTFLKFYQKPIVIDLPAYSYSKKHEKEKYLLKRFFEVKNNKIILTEYNKTAWEIHQKSKEKYISSLGNEFDILIGYFSAGDVIGHLNFGDQKLMCKIYKEFDEIAKLTIKKMPKEKILIISDHGMESVGFFGNHNKSGFYSTNFNVNFQTNPKITDFYKLIKRFAKK